MRRFVQDNSTRVQKDEDSKTNHFYILYKKDIFLIELK